MALIVRIILTMVMYVVQRIRLEKTHYLDVEHKVFSEKFSHRLMLLCHAFPAVILAIVITVKVLPQYSPYYFEMLEENDEVISYTVVGMIVILLFVIGFLIEAVLNLTNQEYRRIKKELKQS